MRRLHRRRRIRHRVRATLRLRESNHLTDVLFPSKNRSEAINTEGESTMWRCTVFKWLKEEAESLIGFFVRDTQTVEYSALQFRFVNTNGA